MRWFDSPVHAVIRLVRSLYWISPAHWYLERQISLERETAADQFALGEPGPNLRLEAREYAAALLNIASGVRDNSGRRHPIVAFHSFERRQLERRILRLISLSTPSSWRAPVLTAMVMLLGLWGTAALPYVAAKPEPRSTQIAGSSQSDRPSLAYSFAWFQKSPIEIVRTKTTSQYAFGEVEVKNSSARMIASITFGVAFGPDEESAIKPEFVTCLPVQAPIEPGKNLVLQASCVPITKAMERARSISRGKVVAQIGVVEVVFAD